MKGLYNQIEGRARNENVRQMCRIKDVREWIQWKWIQTRKIKRNERIERMRKEKLIKILAITKPKLAESYSARGNYRVSYESDEETGCKPTKKEEKLKEEEEIK